MSLQTALDAVSNALALVPSGASGLGQPLTVTLQPPPGQLSLTDLSPATLRATWISKDVLFSKTGTEAALRQAPPNLPTIDAAISGLKPYLSNLGTFISPGGTPGLLGQLIAEMPAVTRTEIPISVKVKWSALDANNAALTSSQFKMLSESASAASLLFAPAIVEATGGGPPTTLRRVRAEVTLEASLPDGSTITNTGAPRPLTLDVQVPALAVPTVLALFNHAPFDLTEHGGIPGCVLVCVPPNGPYRDISSITQALGAASQGLSAVSGAFSSVAFLASTVAAAQAVGRLVDLLTAVTDPTKNVKLIVRATGGERFLDKIIFYQQFLYYHTGEDTFGSLLMVGMPGKAARFYNAREMNKVDGAFTLRLPPDAIAATIETLHNDPPGCDPPAALPVNGEYTSPPGNDTFGDRISSLEFL